MTLIITINQHNIQQLDLSPVITVVEKLLTTNAIAQYEQKLQFEINYERDPLDPRELSEIPEIRLWFIRLDTLYPWFPFLLDWKAKELARYSAMLVPHQFHRTEGIQYNPEALEIWVMQKIFILSNWLQQQQIPYQFRVLDFGQMLGYELELSFIDNLSILSR